MAALCNGGGRLFWGNMLDVFGFKKSFSALALLQVWFKNLRNCRFGLRICVIVGLVKICVLTGMS